MALAYPLKSSVGSDFDFAGLKNGFFVWTLKLYLVYDQRELPALYSLSALIYREKTKMRATQLRRPRKRAFHVPPDTDLDALADRAFYLGSQEHKDYPSWLGQPRLRSDASRCPPWIEKEIAEDWLRTAIRGGKTGAPWEGDFPRYVWYWDANTKTVFEGRLVNRENGSYKGYPLEEDEWPQGYAGKP